jgi:CubicO group peptidase (beta-lactamase class C family)
MKRVLILSLAVSLISFAGLSQNIDKAKLDTYFETLANNNRFMGSVAVSKNNELIYSKSVGFVNIEQGLKANENSKYRIGSISKTFTTALIFKAIEENRLNLNQTIDKFFPAITNASKITVAHLLSHRSGISNFTNDKSYMDWNTQPKTEQEMIETIAKAGSDFEPDTKGSYSNSNFVLLSYILERIYQQSYSELLKEKIIKPTGLKNTYYGGKIDIKNNECHSYKYADSWKIESETDMSIPLGAGGIVSSPIDLNLFSEALFAGKIVSTNSLQQMRNIKDQFGMGLLQMPFYDQTGFGHEGGIDGFVSLFAYFPDSNISFAYTANGMNYNGNDIAIAVLSVVYNKPFEIPEFTAFDITDEELDKYLGVYSSKQLPLKMTITKANGKLFGQGTGQPSFPLESTAKDKFEFKQAGVILEFNPADKTMILKQGGGVFNFERE